MQQVDTMIARLHRSKFIMITKIDKSIDVTKGIFYKLVRCKVLLTVQIPQA